MTIDAHCGTCVFNKYMLTLDDYYRCSKGMRKDMLIMALSSKTICKHWRASVKDMRIWIARYRLEENR